jgi:hypothetical protein
MYRCIYRRFLDLGTSWGELLASRTGHSFPVEIALSTRWIGGQVRPKPLWMTRRDNSYPFRDSNLDLSVVQPAANCCVVPVPHIHTKQVKEFPFSKHQSLSVIT